MTVGNPQRRTLIQAREMAAHLAAAQDVSFFQEETCINQQQRNMSQHSWLHPCTPEFIGR